LSFKGETVLGYTVLKIDVTDSSSMMVLGF